MTSTGLPAFDTSLQKTNEWLQEIAEAMHAGDDRAAAYRALRAVLFAIRDRVTPNEAVQLGDQLPLIVRGIYYEGWKMSAAPLKIRDKADFLDFIESYIDGPMPTDIETVVRAVLGVIGHHVSQGEMEDIRSNLPRHLQDLIPAA